MIVLLGIEISGSEAILTVVDRRGDIVDTARTPLEHSLSEWGHTHPEAYVRGVTQLLTDAAREGLYDPPSVAAIGVTMEHGVTLLDAELDVISPRQLGWSEALDGAADLREAMERLAAGGMNFGRVGVFFSLLDYVRFRMTGAIATHESFVVASRWSVSPSQRDTWDADALTSFGIRRDALPPVFDATCKIGVLGPEIGHEIGFGRNVWVVGGSDPWSARLFSAVEPVDGTRVLELPADGAPRVWKVGAAPENYDPPYRGNDVIPLPVVDRWYWRERDREATLVDPRGAASWSAPDDEQWTIDTAVPQAPEAWAARPSGDVWFAWDAGGPSAGGAIQAGIGLGWWRDLRPLWRKRRAPIDYEDWYNSILPPEDPEDESDVAPTDGAVASEE